MKKIISIILKFSTAVFSFLGVSLALVFSKRDGYSNWYRRLFYFTHQSNIWIGITCLVLAILSVLSLIKKKEYIKSYMYKIKYIFTISITITGLIFCGLLAPFADFNAWSFTNILTHIVVPVLAIVDFFLEDYSSVLKKKHAFLGLLPPFIYFIFASILCLFKVDFGKGDPFPYFFMNFYSEAGFFGFKNGSPPTLGTAYWLIFILLLILGISFLYYILHPSIIKSKKPKNK